MDWVVDGMNLIGSRPDGWWRDRPAARRRLVAELSVFGAERELGTRDLVVVFDGSPTAGEVQAAAAAGVVASFAPGGPDAADHAIAELVEGLAEPSVCTVVTSDAALAQRVRRAGSSVMGVRAFAGLLGWPARRAGDGDRS